MPTFTGFLPARNKLASGGNISSNLNSTAHNQVLRTAGKLSTTHSGFDSNRSPVAITSQLYAGLIEERLYRFFYNRIHTVPQTLDLGNVVGAQTRSITIWNAYFVPQTLTGLTFLNTEGIVATGPQGDVQVFKPLEEKTWQIAISENGPPDINGSINWDFDGVSTTPVGIVGSRITLFSVYPTWEGGILERLEWKTEILSSPLGIEQRRSLRLSPRRSFQLQLIANGRERQYLDLVCFAWGPRNWAIPVWPDVQEMQFVRFEGATQIPCRTTGLDFHVGGLVMFRGDNAFSAEVAEIAAVDFSGLTLKRPLQGTWPIYTKIYPVRQARFVSQPQFTRLTDKNSTVKVEFQVSEISDFDYDASAYIPMYRGRAVLVKHTEESESLTSTYERLLQTLDNDMAIPRFNDTAGLGFTVQQYRWMLTNRVDHTIMRAYMYYLKGSWKPIWVPTFADDITVVADISSTQQQIDIAWIGYAKYVAQAPGRRDILTVLRDGRTFMHRVLDSYELDDTKERLLLDGPFLEDIPASSILRNSFMALCRMENDFAEINHDTDAEGYGATMLTFRSLRDDYDVGV